ncbi:MAG: hypothetical protein QOF68_3082 [Gaiellales bacterium]|jgi:beta-carotene ketolase (CrtO type)|nr:hypothetical protein [Gaiellales bacterium]
MHDVIVVGGGHNGLVCAAYLARSGRRVLVLEQHDVLGGYCSTLDIPGAAGFRGSPFALDFVLANAQPTVADELRLADHGLRWVHPQLVMTLLLPDGTTMPFWRDRARTVAEIRRFSQRDARRYEEFCDAVWGAFRIAIPYLQGHPRRVAPSTLLQILRRSVRGARHLRPAARVFASAADEVLEEQFEREELKTLLATMCLFALSPLEEPGSGATLAFMPLQHGLGIRRPVGGSGAFCEALAASIRHRGSEVRTGARVREIAVRGGRVAGVQLEGGEWLPAPVVVGAVDPTTLLSGLLDPRHVPSQTRDELRAVPVLRSGVSLFTGNVATAERPTFASQVRSPEVYESVVMARGLDHVRGAAEFARMGELPTDPPLWMILPSALDRTLVPPGSAGESLYLYPTPVPVRAPGGDWSRAAPEHLDRCIDVLEEYAPTTRESVVGTRATSPEDLAAYSYRGHFSHVDLVPSRMGPLRPIPSLSGYRTPVRNLWHTGAGAHPMGTINGWSGRTVASTIPS